MRAAKLAELSDEELRREEEGLQETLFRLRFQLQTGNAENPSRLGQTRQDLARVKTILRERELGIHRHRVAPAAPAEAAAAEPAGRTGGKET